MSSDAADDGGMTRYLITSFARDGNEKWCRHIQLSSSSTSPAQPVVVLLLRILVVVVVVVVADFLLKNRALKLMVRRFKPCYDREPRKDKTGAWWRLGFITGARPTP